jgi:hypothetical protein
VIARLSAVDYGSCSRDPALEAAGIARPDAAGQRAVVDDQDVRRRTPHIARELRRPGLANERDARQRAQHPGNGPRPRPGDRHLGEEHAHLRL